MTSEEQQERAALYVLGLLDADEAAVFERELAADGPLHTLTLELREAMAEAARTAVNAVPSPGLKAQVLSRVHGETRDQPAAGKVIAGPSAWMRRVPWAAAAALAISTGALAIFCWSLMTEGIGKGYQLIDSERRAQTAEAELAAARNDVSADDSLRQVVFCPLEPVPASQQSGPQAAVLWNAVRRRGRLRITRLPPADAGKDYQLWTVEAGRKDPVSAGVVKVGADGSAEIEFQPDGEGAVAAFALSVERAGGAPKNEGPIIYLGKL